MSTLYLHKKSNMTGFENTDIFNTYDSDYLNRVIIVNNKIVLNKNIFIIDAKDNDESNPVNITLNEAGTHRFTVLFGCSKTSPSSKWYSYQSLPDEEGNPNERFFYVFAIGDFDFGELATRENVLSGFYPLDPGGADLIPKTAENIRQGETRDIVLNAGTHKISYRDNA